VKREKVWLWVAWHLPRELIKWAFIRTFAEATTGTYALVEAGAVTAMQVYADWAKKKKEAS
jgi:hypothetical protein